MNKNVIFCYSGTGNCLDLAKHIVYSTVESAKANHLKPYEYLKFLLTEVPKHMDDTDDSFLDELLPWAKIIPDLCRKSN